MLGYASACAFLGAGALVFACSGDDETSATATADGGADTSTTTPTSDATSNADGSVVPTPSGPIDPAAAARVAVLLASCISDDGVNRTLQQLYLQRTTNPFRSPAVVACLAAKTNGCGAITDCLGLRYQTDAGCTTDGGCVGNVYEECSGGGFRLSVDCTATALECKPVKGGYCGAPTEVPCDETTTAGVCDGTTPVGCVDGLMRRGRDCAEYGASCGVLFTYTSGGSMVGCKGTGAACDGTSNDDVMTTRFEGVRCENGKLVACVNDGLATLDCATSGVGFTCFDAPDGGANATAYCGTAAECTPKGPWTKVAATCDGTSVVMCNGGKVDKVDCTTLGFTGCGNGVCTPGFL